MKSLETVTVRDLIWQWNHGEATMFNRLLVALEIVLHFHFPAGETRMATPARFPHC